MCTKKKKKQQWCLRIWRGMSFSPPESGFIPVGLFLSRPSPGSRRGKPLLPAISRSAIFRHRCPITPKENTVNRILSPDSRFVQKVLPKHNLKGLWSVLRHVHVSYLSQSFYFSSSPSVHRVFKLLLRVVTNRLISFWLFFSQRRILYWPLHSLRIRWPSHKKYYRSCFTVGESLMFWRMIRHFYLFHFLRKTYT